MRQGSAAKGWVVARGKHHQRTEAAILQQQRTEFHQDIECNLERGSRTPESRTQASMESSLERLASAVNPAQPSN